MKKYFFAFLYLSSLCLSAQDIRDPATTFLDRTEFKVGYTGRILLYNGLNVGAEYLWKEKVNLKNRRSKQKTITHQFLLNGNISFTTNFATNTDAAIFTNYGLTWRRTGNKGRQISIEFNPLGYSRSLLPETFAVNGDDVEKVSFPGRSYYTPSLSVGIGKLRKGKSLTGSYFNINLMWRTHFNGGTLPSVSLQYGYRFKLKKKK